MQPTLILQSQSNSKPAKDRLMVRLYFTLYGGKVNTSTGIMAAFADPNYDCWRKMDDYFRGIYDYTGNMFHPTREMAVANEATLVRYGACLKIRWPAHSWHFNSYQVQFVQPQFAAEATCAFLRKCQCPPYTLNGANRCPRF